MSDAQKGMNRGIGLLDAGQPVRGLVVKKYGDGKSTAGMKGPAEYVEVAAECLMQSFTTKSYIMQEKFWQLMRARGVPAPVIGDFLRDAWVDDESYLRQPDR